MNEEQKQTMDEQVWEVVICDPRKPCGATCPGPKRGEVCYLYAEVECDAKVLRITTEAQKNVTELGYWRDVATGLSGLVDKLRTERNTALVRVKHLETLAQPRVPRALRQYANNLSGFLGKTGSPEEAAMMEETIQKYRDLADQFALLLVTKKGKE